MKFFVLLWVIAILIAGLVAAGALNAANAVPADQIIDVHGNIIAVQQESAVNGWPHAPSTTETKAVVSLVGWQLAGRGRSWSNLCSFGVTMGKVVKCDLVIGRGRSARHWTVRVKVYEDGSYVFPLVRPRRF